ncbi:MAG: RNA-binding domain-containing protein [Candidatus Thorarchaeota archaeon]
MTNRERGPSRIIVQALVQATEDEEKVKKAVFNLFPEEVQEEVRFEQKRLRGHFHNPIIHLEAKLVHRGYVMQTLSSLADRLPTIERQKLQDTFETRIDHKGQLFLRFDKQESYQGRLRLINQGDSLRFVIRFAGSKQTLTEIQSHCQELNLL